jgi:dTDP-4-amino-4,6-dideoxygalactose transaminase
MNYTYTAKLKKIFNLIFLKKITENIFLKNWSKHKINKILSRSSWSLILIAELKKKEIYDRKVNYFFPDYYCSYAMKFIDKNIANIIFYPINQDGTIDINYLNNCKIRIDILVSVNYFGKKITAPYLFDYCKEKKIWLIEDSTHILLPITKKDIGDFIIYSPYKHLSTPLGALLIFNDNGPNNLFTKFNYLGEEKNWNEFLNAVEAKFLNVKNTYFILFRWLLKNIIRNFFKTKNYIKKFDDNNSENIIISPRLDKISKRILINSSYYVNEIIGIRKRSFIIWKNFFKIKNILNIDAVLSDEFLPNFFCVFGKNKNIIKIYNNLKSKNVPVFTWPDLDNTVSAKKKSNALNLRNTRFFLPIHSLENIYYIKKRSIYKNRNLFDNNIKIIFSNFSRTEWTKQLKLFDNINFLQSWEHGYSKSSCFFFLKRKFITIFYKEELVAISQVFEIFFIISLYFINRGPIFKKNLQYEIMESIIINLSSKTSFKKFCFLFFSPNLTLDKNRIYNLRIFTFFKNIGWNSSIVSLCDSTEVIKSKMSSFWRNLINKSNHLYNYDFYQSQDFDDYIFIKKKYYKAKFDKKLPEKYLDYLYKFDSLKIFICKKNRKILSGIFIAVSADVGTYLVSYSSQTSRNDNLNYHLIWFIINFLKIKNFKYFDTGGIDFMNNYNVAKFKKSIGGKYYENAGLNIY